MTKLVNSLAVLLVCLVFEAVAEAQTATMTETVTKTITPTITPTRTKTPTPTKTKTPTPSATKTNTGAPDKASHVHSLEMTLLHTEGNLPDHADQCIAASYTPAQPDVCRCNVYMTRISGSTALKIKCPDGVVHTVTSW